MATYESWLQQRRGRVAPVGLLDATESAQKPAQPVTVLPAKTLREREERFPTFQMVQVSCFGEEHRAEVFNVSLNGICLIGTVQRPTGSPVTIRFRDLCIDGTVAWSGGSAMGVRFLVPLIPEVLASFRTN